MRRLTLDIETKSGTDIDHGSYKYCEDPEFDILMTAWAYDDEEVQIWDYTEGSFPQQLIDDILNPEIEKHAWNANFELDAFERFLGVKLDANQWHCSMVRSAIMGLPMALGKASEVLNIKDAKQKSGKALITWFCNPQKDGTFRSPADHPEKWETFKTYCKYDVLAEREIDNKLKFYPISDFEHKLWVLDRKINQNGVPVDEEFVNACIEMAEEDRVRLMLELRALTNLENPNSVSQLGKWAAERTDLVKVYYTQKEIAEKLKKHYEDPHSDNYGLTPEKYQEKLKWLKENEPKLGDYYVPIQKDKIIDLLTKELPAEVKRAFEIRLELAKTSNRKYNAMSDMLNKCSRLIGLHQFYGAGRTGRWAGRKVQPQNLTKNTEEYFGKDMEILGDVRQWVKDKDFDSLSRYYDNTANLLSQMIRSAFACRAGNRLLVSDFSAIEAVVVAWWAGQQWRLDAFNSNQDIYKASYSRMTGKDISDVSGAERQQGKVLELSMSYQGGPGAISKMDYKNVIPDKEKRPMVRLWRAASPKIKELWKDCNDAALECVKTGETITLKQKGLIFQFKKGCLWIKLPTGRHLCYHKAFVAKETILVTVAEEEYIDPNTGETLIKEIKEKKVIDQVHFWGMNQTTKQWEIQTTYGGKIVENCLAGNVLVLTLRGYIPIRGLSDKDILWDGEVWVTHQGLIPKGVQKTINIDGINLTENHEVLTESGWQKASSLGGHKRPKMQLPYSHRISRNRRKTKVVVARRMYLRKAKRINSLGFQQKKDQELWVFKERTCFKSKSDARGIEETCVLGLEINDRQVQTSYTSSVEKLRRQRNKCLRKVANRVSSFLGGHGRRLRRRANPGTYRRKWKLYSRKLQMGNLQSTGKQQEKEYNDRNALGQNNSSPSLRYFRHKKNNASVQISEWLPAGTFVRKSGRDEPVYDILNAGPNNRFTVLTDAGPLIVHNCTQAIARDCLAYKMMALDQAGYKIIMHVHDEVVMEMPYGKGDLDEVNAIMAAPLDWAPGLPLKAKSFETEFYKKD